MDDKIKEMLDERIQSQIEYIASLDDDDENKTKAIDDLVQLYKLRIEESKNDKELEEKKERRLMELEQESLKAENDLKEQRKDRIIKIVLTAAEVGLPLLFYGRWMKKGFKFEETGSFSSTTFRGLFSKFKPTRK